MPDWKKIKAEYIRGGVSFRKLSEKYSVSFSTLKQIAAREKWTDLRNKSRSIYDTKLAESVAERENKKTDLIQTIADKILMMLNEDMSKFIVDGASMRQVTASIKDLREIKGYKSEIDLQEQMARIEKLRKEARLEDQQSEIKVVIADGLSDYSK